MLALQIVAPKGILNVFGDTQAVTGLEVYAKLLICSESNWPVGGNVAG